MEHAPDLPNFAAFNTPELKKTVEHNSQTTTRIEVTTQHIRIHHIGLHHNTPRGNTTTLLTQLHSYVNEFLKHSPNDMYIVITQLVNLALDTGIVPTDWCIGLICPIYKTKGQRNDPDNYRGITLLSCIGNFLSESWIMQLY